MATLEMFCSREACDNHIAFKYGVRLARYKEDGEVVLVGRRPYMLFNGKDVYLCDNCADVIEWVISNEADKPLASDN